MHIIELQHCGRLLRLDKGACCAVEGEVGAKRSGRCVHSWSASPLCPHPMRKPLYDIMCRDD